jgi:hypothetical protein
MTLLGTSNLRSRYPAKGRNHAQSFRIIGRRPAKRIALACRFRHRGIQFCHHCAGSEERDRLVLVTADTAIYPGGGPRPASEGRRGAGSPVWSGGPRAEILDKRVQVSTRRALQFEKVGPYSNSRQGNGGSAVGTEKLPQHDFHAVHAVTNLLLQL